MNPINTQIDAGELVAEIQREDPRLVELCALRIANRAMARQLENASNIHATAPAGE